MQSSPYSLSGKTKFMLSSVIVAALAVGGGVFYISIGKPVPAWLASILPGGSAPVLPAGAPSSSPASAPQTSSRPVSGAPAASQAGPSVSAPVSLPSSAVSAAPVAEGTRNATAAAAAAGSQNGTAVPSGNGAASAVSAAQVEPGNIPPVAPKNFDVPPSSPEAVSSGDTGKTASASEGSRNGMEKAGGTKGGDNASTASGGKSATPAKGAASAGVKPARPEGPQPTVSRAEPVDEENKVLRGRAVLAPVPDPAPVGEETQSAARQASASAPSSEYIAVTPTPPRRPAFKGEDSMVTLDFFSELAAFMADNYWPAGTHPQAAGTAVSTANIKWANLKFGGQFKGLAVKSENPNTSRALLQNYVLMPSMVKALHRLYEEPFMHLLDQAGRDQMRGAPGKEKPFTNADMAGMYGYYSGKMRSLSGAMHSYLATDDMDARVAALIEADHEAELAAQKLTESRDGINPSDSFAAAYQRAVIKRTQARDNIAAAMRRSGNTRGLDSDSLVYVALWMHRRDHKKNAALDTAATVLEETADRMEMESARYKNLPPSSPAGTEAASEAPAQ